MHASVLSDAHVSLLLSGSLQGTAIYYFPGLDLGFTPILPFTISLDDEGILPSPSNGLAEFSWSRAGLDSTKEHYILVQNNWVTGDVNENEDRTSWLESFV